MADPAEPGGEPEVFTAWYDDDGRPWPADDDLDRICRLIAEGEPDWALAEIAACFGFGEAEQWRLRMRRRTAA